MLKVSSIAVASEEKLMAANLSASASWMLCQTLHINILHLSQRCRTDSEKHVEVVQYIQIYMYIYIYIMIYKLYTCIYLHTFVCSPDDKCIVQSL